MKQQPTIVDIAKKLDISPSSVSRALRGVGKVGEELKKRIIEEANAVGYVPNISARSLRHQSSQLIGLIMPSFFSHQIDQLIESIQTYAQKRDFGIILGLTQFNTDSEISQLDFMLSRRVEGIIIKSKGSPEVLEKLETLSKTSTKIISLLDPVDIPNTYSILSDNVKGGYMAGKHLIENGHTRILYVTYTTAQSSEGNDAHFSRERYAGLLKAYEEAGIKRPFNLVVYDDSSPLERNGQFDINFSKFIEERNDFTAIFAYDDHIAAGVTRVLDKKGYKVPDDFSVVGFDDSILVNLWCNPPLTVVKQPNELLGFEAVNIILGSKENSKIKSVDNLYIIEPELKDRGSVRKIN